MAMRCDSYRYDSKNNEIDLGVIEVAFQRVNGHFENMLHAPTDQVGEIQISSRDKLRFLGGARINHIVHIRFFDENRELLGESYYYTRIK